MQLATAPRHRTGAGVHDGTVRVGLVAPPWVPVPPPAYGGTESTIDLLARGLTARGHEVVLVSTGDATCPVERRWAIEVAEWPHMGSTLVELRHVLFAHETLRDCDLVHDHTTSGPLTAPPRAAPPLVCTNHLAFSPNAVEVFRRIARRAVVVAISHNHAAAATAEGVAIGRVIHHGIDSTEIEPGDGDGGYVLFLGRMAPEKGVAQAAAAAREAGMKLVIAAKMRDASERSYFESVVEPMLGVDVVYVGEVGVERKFDLLRGARALLNPIRWAEPFGMVMIEAMACGTPVIANRIGSVPELVDHGVTGFVCDDEADLVHALGKVDQLDRAVVRTSVEERFSVERMIDAHIELYDDVVAGRVTPAAS
jgi:glycosyltransferase involved in cell wall biosynthesis